LSDSRKIKRMLSQLEDHSSLVMAMSQADIPWLRQMLQTALKNGASVCAILRMIEDALERGYKPRGHSKESVDLAMLVYRLGGGNLLYALNQRLALPSLRTLRNKMSFVKIAPTVGRISSESVKQNIQDVVLAPRLQTGVTTRCGVSILIDETALEEAAVYLNQSNCVGGLCWNHSHLIDPVLHNYQSALNIADALKSGKVHLGKEMTVAGVHVFGEDGVYPLIAAPTCKTEEAPDMEFIFDTLMDAWTAMGADKVVGDIWSVATDGDSTRRKAGHKLFLWAKIPITSPLYGVLSNLPGINMFTGNEFVTLDFDYKHIFKRFCTLIRSRAGMYLNNGRCISAHMLERYLPWLEGIDEAATRKLLYPDDPQDVPRAVELMSAIISLSRVNPTLPPFTPAGAIPDVAVLMDFEALVILGHILDSLLQPFINIHLTLSEQVTHLSRFSHLLYASYRDQRRRLMPNQLYYDSQTMVKNAVVTIVKQQKLNP
ncbi:hypothetical protein HYDPIDRAFT_60297, partial [Hydnomerulius pinastri MD-312]